jgi:hypothetical protein
MKISLKQSALLLAIAGCADAPDSATTTTIDQAEHCDTSALFPVDSHPYGTSLEGWAERWWQWGLGIPLAQNPNDTPNVSADIHQDGPVYFLPNPPPGGSTTFTVPRHEAAAVLLSSVINDYPCPDPTFQPAPGQSLLDFLLAGAVAADTVASITATLDGASLGDLSVYHFTSSKLMQFTGDPSLAVLDNCITGSPQPAALEAHFMILKPLPSGTHVLAIHRVTLDGVAHDRTVTIVVPGH